MWQRDLAPAHYSSPTTHPAGVLPRTGQASGSRFTGGYGRGTAGGACEHHPHIQGLAVVVAAVTLHHSQSTTLPTLAASRGQRDCKSPSGRRTVSKCKRPLQYKRPCTGARRSERTVPGKRKHVARPEDAQPASESLAKGPPIRKRQAKI